ncbi:MAG: GDP-mannose 4,6-dehydratase [Candidatus Delongbacteria bacterium]|nr:GDP-mannose 4,6-dehydratase [Candidatus Delongbacteria bacterium]
MKYLITGGAGFIGFHLSEFLLRQGHSVMVIDDLSTGSFENIKPFVSHSHYHFAVESILNHSVMDRLVSECDGVIHLAAAVGVELIVEKPVSVIETNILGSEMVLKIANRYRKKVFVASTSEVYGKSDHLPFKEEDDMVIGPTSKHRWSYACSKAIDEFLALAYHRTYQLPVIIGRFFNTIGPRQTGRYGMVVPRLVKQALENKPLTVYGDGKQTRCFTDVQDVIRAIVLLLEQENAIGRVVNIGNDQPISIESLAEKIRIMTGSSSELVYIPYHQAYEEGFEDMRHRQPDTGLLMELTGFKPTISLDKILRDIIEDCRKTLNG